MITQLYIKNVAVIKEINIDFTNGLNVFTGETGAGKSILVDSINAILGNRTSKNIVRTGESKAEITAVFYDNSDIVINKLIKLGVDNDEDDIIITRTITSDGKNNCKINNKPVTVNMLRELGVCLIDIHGQQDNGYLLKESNHQKMIDDIGLFKDVLINYKEHFKLLVSKKKELDRLLDISNDKDYKIEILEHQINEISSANIENDFDEDILLENIHKYRNSDKVNRSLINAYNMLNGDIEYNTNSVISIVKNDIDNISDLDSRYKLLGEKISTIKYQLEDISTEISNLMSNLDITLDIDYLENRLSLVRTLKSKYGDTTYDITEFLENVQDELSHIQSNDDMIDTIENEAQDLINAVNDIALKLTKKREQSVKQFIGDIKNELIFLNMPHINISFSNEKGKLKSNGVDNITLLLATNKGQEPQSISRVASGGELSRIMLAIKTIAVNGEDFKTMIFDEIDSGVSGASSNKIGQKLRDISRNTQVICITHSPQIAAFSHNHLKIIKETVGNNTFTRVESLSLDERKVELARIISGDNITETAINNAEEMINIANSMYL